MKTNATIVLSENPSALLWLVNCILYSVIVAFYVVRGERSKVNHEDQKLNTKAKKKFEAQVSEILGKLSKAKVEIEGIQSNRKLTKKGKRMEKCL